MRNYSAIKLFSTLALGAMTVSAGAALSGKAIAAAEMSLAGDTPVIRTHAGEADQRLQESVQNALQSDAYFSGAHVNVSLEKGNVVLRGFVFSEWDLRDAIRIATKAAGGRRVIDDLTIEVGGRR